MTGRPRGKKGMTEIQLKRRKEKLIKRMKELPDEEVEK